MSTNSYLLRVGVAYYPFPVSQSIYQTTNISTNSYLLRVGVAYYPFPVSQSIYLGRCAHLSGHIKVTHQPNFLDVEHLTLVARLIFSN